MENHFVKNGLIMGVASIVLSLALYLINPKFMLGMGAWLGYAVVIYFMYKTIAEVRADNNEIISLGSGFKASWLSYIIGTIISTIFSFILMNYIDTGLLDLMRETQIEAIEKMADMFNLPEDVREEQIAAIESANPFGLGTLAMMIPMSFIFPGALIAVIMAAIMKKEEKFAL